MENQSDILGQPGLNSKTTSEKEKKKGNKKNQILISDSLITNQRSHHAKLATLLRFFCFHRDPESMVLSHTHQLFCNSQNILGSKH